jgi:hypothetical protein
MPDDCHHTLSTKTKQVAKRALPLYVVIAAETEGKIFSKTHPGELSFHFTKQNCVTKLLLTAKESGKVHLWHFYFLHSVLKAPYKLKTKILTEL